MNNPFLNTLRLRLFYVGSWVMIIIAQLLTTFYYFGMPAGENSLMSVLDSGMCNILQAVCILALWHPVRFYGNIKNVPLFLLFHLTLFLISCIIWIGLSYCAIQYLVLPNNVLYTPYFLTLLPVRIVAGIFIYVIFVLAYYLLLSRSELQAQKLSAEEKIAASSSTPIEKLTRIIVKKNSEYHFILVNQIRYIEANGDYVTIFTESNRYLKDQTMKYWEIHLPDDNFVRIHRSFIVNIETIAKIELYEKEIYKVHLKNGDVLKASSAGYKLLKQKMHL
ncbi:MAG: LytTR family transcriptional regulator DNA-binding domain-containing protein [Candidatus Azobacteroides sp.]|nr:LytTR family transcriptional regulator DNA-binding domain-containing protein [Candidatus Azobacteroides sp.]